MFRGLNSLYQTTTKPSIVNSTLICNNSAVSCSFGRAPIPGDVDMFTVGWHRVESIPRSLWVGPGLNGLDGETCLRVAVVVGCIRDNERNYTWPWSHLSEIPSGEKFLFIQRRETQSRTSKLFFFILCGNEMRGRLRFQLTGIEVTHISERLSRAIFFSI